MEYVREILFSIQDAKNVYHQKVSDRVRIKNPGLWTKRIV